MWFLSGEATWTPNGGTREEEDELQVENKENKGCETKGERRQWIRMR